MKNQNMVEGRGIKDVEKEKLLSLGSRRWKTLEALLYSCKMRKNGYILGSLLFLFSKPALYVVAGPFNIDSAS